MAAEIEIRGLKVATHHGVTEDEREAGQTLTIDISLIPAAGGAETTDRLEDTVDYGAVATLAAELAAAEQNATLERVCARIAEGVMGRFRCESVWVRAAKTEPPLDLDLDEVAVSVVRGEAPGG